MTDRGLDGKFVKGSKGGPGRTPRALEENVTALIDSVVTPEDWRDVITKLLVLAKRGNLAAINQLLDRRFGKPTEHHEHTGEDGAVIRVNILTDDIK